MIDNIIVFAYLVAVLMIGIYNRSYSKSFHGYGFAGKGLQDNKFVLVATIFASAIGGGTVFGITEKAFWGNLAYTYALIFTIPVDVIIGIFVIPKIAKYHGSISVGDIVSNFYGKPGRIISGIATIAVSFGLLAAQISVSGRIFQYMLKVNHIEGIVLSYIIIILYTSVGGFRSIIFTNLLQFMAIVIGIPCITAFGLHDIGILKFAYTIPSEKYSLANHGLLLDTILLSISFTVFGLRPSLIQRGLITKNTKVTKQAIKIKSIIYLIFITIITINGLIAYKFAPNLNPVLTIPYIIDHVIPTGLKGVVIIGFLAAVMSTADSDLNIVSISIVNDILRPLVGVNNQRALLIAAKISTVLMGTLAIIIALLFDNVLDLVIFITGFWAPIMFVPFIAGLYNVFTSKKLFIIGSVVGILTFIIWEYTFPEFKLKSVFVGVLANFICFVASCWYNRVEPQ